MIVELTIFSHKIKIFVLFLSSFFCGGGGSGRKSYIDGTSQNNRADAILMSIHNLRTREKLRNFMNI